MARKKLKYFISEHAEPRPFSVGPDYGVDYFCTCNSLANETHSDTHI